MNQLDNLIKTFHTKSQPNPKLVKTVWRIKIDGKIITTLSKKSVWKRIGDAKNALRNHVSAFCQGQSFWDRSNIDCDKLYKDLVSSGRVEFVAVELE